MLGQRRRRRAELGARQLAVVVALHGNSGGGGVAPGPQHHYAGIALLARAPRHSIAGRAPPVARWRAQARSARRSRRAQSLAARGRLTGQRPWPAASSELPTELYNGFSVAAG